MTTIEILIRDKDGQILNQVTAKSYELGQEVSTLSEIEGAIDQLKNRLLPALEADLLAHQQQKTMAELKKATR